MLKNKTMFITGGAGFIANTLIKNYIDDNKIIVYDNFHRDTLTNSGLAKHKNIKIVKGDVLDFSFLKESMKGSDIVVHAAGIAGIDTESKIP
jgi:UDP-glucose 4-epimerase